MTKAKMTPQEQNGATRFSHIKGVLAAGGQAIVGLKPRYIGPDSVARFERDFANDLTNLHYSQCSVMEANVKYVTRSSVLGR